MMIEQVCLACELKYGPKVVNGVRTLGMFDTYTVDFRLHQFRKVSEEHGLLFIEFGSDEGQALLAQMHEAVVNDREPIRV